jgi:glc operon protein GlcG
MNTSLRTAAAVLLAAVANFGTMAQQAPAPNPLDVIPEKQPFDMPYGAPVSLERAEVVLGAALAEARNRGWKMVCAVADSGATLVALKRMDGGLLASVDIAMHKARAAVKFRRDTKNFEAGVQSGLTYLVTLDDFIASRGGIPLVDGGRIVGAIGCSGGTGSQDEAISKAGVAAFK